MTNTVKLQFYLKCQNITDHPMVMITKEILKFIITTYKLFNHNDFNFKLAIIYYYLAAYTFKNIINES